MVNVHQKEGSNMDFFNDIGKRFSSAAKSVQKRTRENVEAGKLNAQMRALREERSKIFKALGETYYNTLNGGEGKDQIDFLVEQLRQGEAKAAELQAQIDKLAQQKRCPQCGKAVALDARFCSSCGARIVEEAPAEEAEEKAAETVEFCPSCGAPREAGSAFCSVCGHAYEAQTETTDNADTEEIFSSLDDPAEAEKRITMEIKWPQASEEAEPQAADEAEPAAEDKENP